MHAKDLYFKDVYADMIRIKQSISMFKCNKYCPLKRTKFSKTDLSANFISPNSGRLNWRNSICKSPGNKIDLAARRRKGDVFALTGMQGPLPARNLTPLQRPRKVQHSVKFPGIQFKSEFRDNLKRLWQRSLKRFSRDYWLCE